MDFSRASSPMRSTMNGRLLIDRVSPLKRQFLKKKIAKQAKEQ